MLRKVGENVNFNYLKTSNQNRCLFFEYLKKIVQNSEVEGWSDQFSSRPPLRAFTVLAKKKPHVKRR